MDDAALNHTWIVKTSTGLFDLITCLNIRHEKTPTYAVYLTPEETFKTLPVGMGLYFYNNSKRFSPTLSH